MTGAVAAAFVQGVASRQGEDDDQDDPNASSPGDEFHDEINEKEFESLLDTLLNETDAMLKRREVLRVEIEKRKEIAKDPSGPCIRTAASSHCYDAG